jgi:hypothetical protein
VAAMMRCKRKIETAANILQGERSPIVRALAPRIAMEIAQ